MAEPTTSSIPPAPDAAQSDSWQTLWRLLSQPLLVIISGLLTLALLLSARALPQLPGQLADDRAATARWLAGQRADFGGFGDLLASLGLFDLLHSPLFGVLLAVTALLLLIHLANWINDAIAFRNLPDMLAQPATGAGEPLALPTVQPLYRVRTYAAAAGRDVDPAWLQTLAARFDQRIETSTSIKSDSLEGASQGDEVRVLLMRRRWASFVRPVHVVGLLIAIISVWITALAGWQIDTPLLAPGEHFRYAGQDIDINYDVQERSQRLEPVIRTQIGNEIELHAVEGQSAWRTGEHDVLVKPGPLALLVTSTNGVPELKRPGAETAVAKLGLLFATSGSEQSFLLPGAALGLRIVRAAEGADGFSVEVFASDDILPVQRFSVVGSVTVDIGAADGADNSEMVALNFAPLPALTVTVGYAPVSWLLWLALVLTLVGLVGVLMPPGFLLLQLAAWPVDRTVLVAQSDHTDDIQAVVQTLPGLPAGQSGAEGSAHG